MDPKEAHRYVEDLQRMLTQYRFHFSEKFIEANGVAVEALEKQIPNKSDHGCCPWCSTSHNFITDNLGHPEWHPTVYCWNCGQAIDWGEE